MNDTDKAAAHRRMVWRFRPSLWPTAATLLLLSVLVSLGLWQYGRAGEKAQLRDQFLERAAQPMLDLTDGVDPGQSPESFAPASITGRYASEHQFLLDNRTLDGKVGYEVFSIFVSHNDRNALAVNRGWVPVGFDRSVLPDVAVGREETRITGILALPPRPGLLLGDSGYAGQRWPRVVQLVDLDEMARRVARPLMNRVLLLGPQEPNGYVRRWKPYFGIGPERHIGYSLQWFSLALALLVIYLVFHVKREPEIAGGNHE